MPDLAYFLPWRPIKPAANVAARIAGLAQAGSCTRGLVLGPVLSLAWGLMVSLALGLAQPVHAEPAEQALGKNQGYPVGTQLSNWYTAPYRVGSWSALDQVPGLVSRRVPRQADGAARNPSPLPQAAQPPAIGYRFRNLPYTLDDYLQRQQVTGLLVLKNGEIIAEHYRYQRRPEARFLSFSMAKSITALLVGVALERGHIRSLDDRADAYASALAGSAYGATPLRALLRMSSGLTFTERYDGNDDIARLSRAAATGSPGVLSVLHSVSDRHSPAGEKFVYASAETEVLGLVLAGATGRNLSELTAQWLWQPLGAEHDASWILAKGGTWSGATSGAASSGQNSASAGVFNGASNGTGTSSGASNGVTSGIFSAGAERASGFFSASLRDWARVGLLLANDGRVAAYGAQAERQLIAREFLLDATDPARQSPAFAPRRATPYMGYGYQFWLLPMKTRSFAMQGIHGQAVYVQPASGIVMVHTAVFDAASGRQDPAPASERDALWRGVLQSLGGSVAE